MLATTLLGVALIFAAVQQSTVHQDYPKGYVYVQHHTKQGTIQDRSTIVKKPVSEFKYHNVVHQAFDYSCGSAALTTVLNEYLGRQFKERQIMEGLLRFGETDKIIQRRGFSLLDMKRLVTALGHPSGGFRADFSDLKTLDHPAIVPIHYAGFKHFVVLKKYKDGHIFVADPAIGNISFTAHRFKQVWGPKVLFIVFPNGFKPHKGLELTDWDLRIIDEKTLSRTAFMQFPQFLQRAQQDADEASTLIRVRVDKTDGSGGTEVLNIPTRTYYHQ